MSSRPDCRLVWPLVALTLGLAACSSGPQARIPAVPSAMFVRERTAPVPTQDSVEVTRQSTGDGDSEHPGRVEEHVAQGSMPKDARIVVDVAEGGVEPAAAAFTVGQRVHMTLLGGGYQLIDRESIGPAVSADYALKIRRLRIATSDEREVDLTGVQDVQDFLARNPGLEVPTTIRVPVMVAHLDGELVQVETGRILWAGSVSADLIDALGEAAKVRIECTRTVGNGAQITAAIQAHNQRVADADARAKEAWRLLADSYDRRLGYEETARRQATFDAAAAELEQLATPPAEAGQAWEYEYTSRFEFTEELGEGSDVTGAARENMLIRHVVELLLATIPTT